tara:strand:+ start:152 stop:379 length:228 start_codon:yes stop_codon:yes gene_type:complete
VGIEPTLPKELDFESSASTSSATKAATLKLIILTKFHSKLLTNSFNDLILFINLQSKKALTIENPGKIIQLQPVL